ncbi:MAG: MFS transporter [Lachnospiraceae bacterium]|nr:MFS transporter [Lachnospiraceae bacterium]
MEKKRFHYAWVVCGSLMFLLFCNMGMSNAAFPSHFPFMRQSYGLTNAQCSTLSMVRNFTSLVCMLFVDRYLKLFHIKKGILIANALVVVSFVIYGLAPDYATCLAAAVISGTGYSFGGLIAASALLNRWFKTGRRFAIGLCSAGTGMASVILPPLNAALTGLFSLPVNFFIEAAIIAFAGILGVLLLREDPERAGMMPLDHVAGAKEEETYAAGTGREQNARRSAIVLACIACGMMGFAIYGSYPALELHLVSQGFEVVRAASYISVFGLMLTIGKIVYGYIADRFGALRITVFCYTLNFTGMLLVCLAGTAYGGVICLFAVFIWGFGNAISTVLQPTLAGELATDAEYTRIAKNIQVFYTAGSVAIGPLPGWIADTFGSYIPSYILLAFIMFCSMCLTCLSLHRGK